jgi:hypothetical protein
MMTPDHQAAEDASAESGSGVRLNLNLPTRSVRRHSTQEIAGNVNEAAAGTQQVSANIVGVSRGATETGAAASSCLSGLSRRLNTFTEKAERGR